MPLYDFHCDQCGRTDEYVLRMSEIGTDAEPTCCNHRMQQVFTTPRMGSVQQECRYVCPATGERITSWRQRANNFAKNNLMDANDFSPAYLEKRDAKKWGAIREKVKQYEATLPKGVDLSDFASTEAH